MSEVELTQEQKYDEFEKEMHERFPEMFTVAYGGFAVGAGWFKVIKALCHNIQSHIKWTNERYERDVKYNEMLTQMRQGNMELFDAYMGNVSELFKDNRREELLNEELHEIKNPTPQVIVHQIKEKFGGLRFYYEGGDDYVYGLVSMAEAWAANTCEKCGESGKLRHGGWIRTLCDKHEQEYQDRQKEDDLDYGDEVSEEASND